jgi:predicted small lipoprotein YifL
MKNRLFLVLASFIFSASLLVSGCGQTGPLTLPSSQDQSQDINQQPVNSDTKQKTSINPNSPNKKTTN